MPAPSPHPVSARRGRPVLALALYLLAVFAGGALLAPWLYHGVRALADSVPALRGVAEMPFGRYVNRALLLTALLTLPFYLRGAGIRSWSDAGFSPRRFAWGRFGVGFVIGYASLAAVCGIALVMGARAFRVDRTPAELAVEFVGALLTALVVAVIEELLFRGAVFGGLRRALPWGVALLASSALYGIVHFMTRPVSPPAVGWSTGLEVLPTLLAGMGDVRALVPGFFSLTLAGVVLGLAYQKTGDLAAPIGIHAGWIFWLKFYGLLTRSVPGVDPWFWGTRKLTDGWLAFTALVLVLAAVAAAGRRRPPGV
ncbi:MAG TPA: CPBP family intramembrane glutamic endopeptidase [Longimicrobiaceae bacterium]|nr:CPBP family intramembrane glutamic endopeptidase [Longimicrobiaceae bacterium]